MSFDPPPRFRVSQRYTRWYAGTVHRVEATIMQFQGGGLVPFDLSGYDSVRLQAWLTDAATTYHVDEALTVLTDAADLVDGVAARFRADVTWPASPTSQADVITAFVGVTGGLRTIFEAEWESVIYPGDKAAA